MVKHLVCYIIFCCHAYIALGQHASKLGRFEVDGIKGCAPLSINITDFNKTTTDECTSGKPCLVDFESSGVDVQNATTHTYTAPGTYTLKVLYQSIGEDEITIVVEENTSSSFEVHSCNNNSLQIVLEAEPYDQYIADFGDGTLTETLTPPLLSLNHQYSSSNSFTISVRGVYAQAVDNCQVNQKTITTTTNIPPPNITMLSIAEDQTILLEYDQQTNVNFILEMATDEEDNFQLLSQLYGGSSYTSAPLNIADHYYCFRMATYDPCADTRDYANAICSHQLKALALTDENEINWETATSNINTINILRNDQLLDDVSPTTTQYIDREIVCKESYCYQLISHYANGAQSISRPNCITAISNKTPPTVDNISIIASDSTAQLVWLTDPSTSPKTHSVFRSIYDATNRLIGRVTENTITDRNYKPDRPTCYQISFIDQCGNENNPGIIACPIQLSATIDETNQIQLNWNSYSGWRAGVKEYELQKFDQHGTLLTSINMGTTLSYQEIAPDLAYQEVYYQIIAHPTNSDITISKSNKVHIIKNTVWNAPNAFTPNGDNLNDTFYIIGSYIEHLDLWIFDRWGSLVFISEDGTPWDGTRNGKEMPPSVYYWRAEIKDGSGKTVSRSGTLLLIRDN